MRAEDFTLNNLIDPTEIHQVKVMLSSRSWGIISRMLKNQALCMLVADPSPIGEAKAKALYDVATLDRDRFDELVHSELVYAPHVVEDPVPEV